MSEGHVDWYRTVSCLSPNATERDDLFALANEFFGEEVDITRVVSRVSFQEEICKCIIVFKAGFPIPKWRLATISDATRK